MPESLVYTNSNCIGCNKCIRVCTSYGACVAAQSDNKRQIHVDADKCIACGACLDVCVHNAREFRDDTADFFNDLKNGENISVLIAPSFKANYPNEYNIVLGGLKKLGVKRFLNVSFGADITTWAYVNYISKTDKTGGISQPCPAVVGYIERHIPELIPQLFPIQSPLICTAIYAKKYMNITDKLAFISPCIAKKMEIDDPNTHGYVSYNLTFKHFMKYMRDNNLMGEPYNDEIEYGLGSYFPVTSGLMQNIFWFLGEDAYVRTMCGEKRMFSYLEKNKESILKGINPFKCIDALNCSEGCLSGTGCDTETQHSDKPIINLTNIRDGIKTMDPNSPWARNIPPFKRLENLNRHFESLDFNDFKREYTDRSSSCSYIIPTEEDYDRIFKQMNKFTEDERSINCAACGYDSCKDMAMAIHNGLNFKENCIYYLRHEADEQRHNAEIRKAADEAKSRFLANMSHEIRTPINAVLGMNNMILKNSKDNEILGYSQNINTASKNLLSLINDILDLSKIEEGKLEIVPEEFDFPKLIKEILSIHTISIANKGLAFNTEFISPIPCKLIGDSTRIRQIISNFLSNAMKYTQDGSVTLSFDSKKTDDNKCNIIISVSDTGMGIKEESLPLLFDKFQRFDLSKNRSIEGSGLGLNITKSIITSMGGTIDVVSEYGKGSTFTATLPLELVDDSFVDNLESINKEEESITENYTPTLDGKRILIVDDLQMNLTVLHCLLDTTHAEITESLSAKDAIEKTKKAKYDLIFMDHMMPEMDGIEACQAIRNDSSNPNCNNVIIVQTANAMRGAREEYLSKDFTDCLFKPVNPDDLNNLLRKYVGCQ